MKIYIKEHKNHAGKWIYAGYKSAWEQLGYDVEYYSDLHDIKEENYQLMAIDADVNFSNISKLEKADKVYLYVQPNRFPLPWGSHPNFVSLCHPNVIDEIIKMDNVHKWAFGIITDFHDKWGDVNEIPLAFDSVNYAPVENENYQFDVCFVGGWANNGFNEKRKIMIQHLSPFKDSGLKCGFFINRGISHAEENLILSNSKLAINIHDAYQRTLGLDTNERTFKSLGLTGLLVSDTISQIENLFPEMPMYDSPDEMMNLVKKYIDMAPQDVVDLKLANRKKILDDHTYKNRVQELLSL
jgi:hypothetical protein